MNDIHENDKLSYVDYSGSPIKSISSDILDAISCEMSKYRQISFTIDDNKHNKLGFDLHQMWGIYADKGYGVCLVFDKASLCERIDETYLSNAVTYDNAVNSFYIANSDDHLSIQQEIQYHAEEIFFYKRKEWEHEQEYRLIKRFPNLMREEYLDYGNALKYIILNSIIENNDICIFKEMLRCLKIHAADIPILIYSNGLLEYSLF